ncbi:hypothetical protein CCR85_09580 [Rhodothalassium salexigens]|uniref:VOC family protein n=1 Tax=Rhodothalassium salexigens TaxID=1086 RepID=UPI0019139E09|nr:VOC family protein [Rhodothalassium salexigens]MBK5911735.1 hypothetical protein [Rhodothalassium salexigens]MBK5920477.1 hypothetical protein [Rhodothalassium salexigens]
MTEPTDAATEREGPFPGFEGVAHMGLTVPDLDGAIAFYQAAFGARLVYRLGPLDSAAMPTAPDGRDWTAAHIDVPGARLHMALVEAPPNLALELFQYDAPADRVRVPPRNCDAGGHHLNLRVRDLDAAVDHLTAHGCTPLAGPITAEEGPLAAMVSHYLRDPWGNYIELTQYLPRRPHPPTGGPP